MHHCMPLFAAFFWSQLDTLSCLFSFYSPMAPPDCENWLWAQRTAVLESSSRSQLLHSPQALNPCFFRLGIRVLSLWDKCLPPFSALLRKAALGSSFQLNVGYYGLGPCFSPQNWLAMNQDLCSRKPPIGWRRAAHELPW